MNKDEFRPTTKINQKEKVGVFTSGLFLLILPGVIVFFFSATLFNRPGVGFFLGSLILLVLLISGGLEPYKFMREIANMVKKKRWTWGRKPAKSIFNKRD